MLGTRVEKRYLVPTCTSELCIFMTMLNSSSSWGSTELSVESMNGIENEKSPLGSSMSKGPRSLDTSGTKPYELALECGICNCCIVIFDCCPCLSELEYTGPTTPIGLLESTIPNDWGPTPAEFILLATHRWTCLGRRNAKQKQGSYAPRLPNDIPIFTTLAGLSEEIDGGKWEAVPLATNKAVCCYRVFNRFKTQIESRLPANAGSKKKRGCGTDLMINVLIMQVVR